MHDPVPIPVIPTLSGEVRRHIRRHRCRALGHVALLHFGRVGSRVFEERLSASIDVVSVEGRILDHEHPVMLEVLRGRCPEPPRRVLASLTLGHARRVDLGYERLLQGLEEMGFTHFVLLTQRDYLGAVLSRHASSDGRVSLDPEAVEIDGECRSLCSLFAQWDRDRAELRARLQSRRRLELSYEDDVADDPTWACLWASDFLGIAQVPVKLRAESRPPPREIPQLVEDYERVQAHLAGTRWAWMAPPPS